MMQRTAILDTNLLLLFVVGNAGTHYLDRHKRINIVEPEEAFAALQRYLTGFSQLIATPNTLTETSNLLRLIGEPTKTILTIAFQKLIAGWPEQYVSSCVAAGRPEFPRLGLTDATLLHLASDAFSLAKPCLVTTDLDLYLAAAGIGINVVNFNHIRYDA